ncbi:MAG: hypothetical protein NTV95_00250 [Candidatus Saccharibacteria bacterium]|nr:hypothetical protein [Candidatus Saccharibacteria bacterium]
MSTVYTTCNDLLGYATINIRSKNKNMEDTTPTPLIPPAESTGMLDRAKDFANKLKPVAAIALIALGGAGCSIDRASVDEPPTQHDVAEVSIGDISVGAERDANGMFNTREAVDAPNNKYNKDGSIIDAVEGLPSLVIGVKDPAAGNAPKSDGNVFEESTKTTPGKTTYETVDGGTKTVITPGTKEVTTETSISGEDKGNTQYERDFETDITTFEQALTPAEKITQETLELIQDGYTVTSVRVNGKASGEDHTVNSPSANIGEPSLNNIQLAEQRGQRGADALQTEMEKQGVELSGVPIMVGGNEVEPTIEQMAQLTSAASELGISVSELTERFNTHVGGLNPEQTQLLMETLVNNRGVAFEIRASKTENVEDGTFITTVVELPPEVRATVQPSIEKNSWLFRIEIPGEVLLLLAAVGIGAGLGSIRGGISPRTPGLTSIGPRPTGGFGPRPIPGGPGTIEVKPTPIPPPEEPPTSTPRPRSRSRQEILTKGPGIEDRSARGTSRKQPREQNFGKNSPQAAGGRGRMARSRGGNRRGKRG